TGRGKAGLGAWRRDFLGQIIRHKFKWWPL
ncbi:hypothetical protein DBR06_SOUSAS4810022, partial [Sousa chinensis]